jgi:hexokinase
MSIGSYLIALEDELTLAPTVLGQISHDFCAAMRRGLSGEQSSLKMLPSFLGVPSGSEIGNALAIDFGGTNLRVLEAQLKGDGHSEIVSVISVPLIDPQGSYNYTSSKATGEDLFGFIVDRLLQIAKPDVQYALGHTFSFPCEQTDVNSATLIGWTKEIQTCGVEGQDVGALLSHALSAKGATLIRSSAIINDTVGTLLSGAYSWRNVDIASICGTGHNSCYLETSHPLTGRPMIVNMESGNFDEIPRSRFDETLDVGSARPGLQRLEKMASGHYLGSLFRLVLVEMVTLGYVPPLAKTQREGTMGAIGSIGSIGGKFISDILQDTSENSTGRLAIEALFAPHEVSETLCSALTQIARLIATRSARLVAATFVGVIHHIDSKFDRPHEIAIDGSLYEKMPGYGAWIQQALDELSPKGAKLSTRLAKDGSGLGAAIAAIVSK